MKQKIIAVSMATIMVFLVASALGSATSISKKNNEGISPASIDVDLGSATIYGDGIEGNSDVDAETEKELTIKISNDPEYLNLKMDYSIQCDGDVDQGRIYLFVQLNGLEVDNVSIIEEGNQNGQITIDNVEVTNGDVLTWEIGTLYTNFDPFFTDQDVDIGATVIIKSRSMQNRFFNSPLYQIFQRIPILFRLFF